VILRRALVVLIAVALVLPIVTLILLGTSRLLSAMDDQAGAGVLDRLALAAGVLWAIDLVVLVIVQGLHTLGPPHNRPDFPPE
jgi:hypothetical protein